MPERYFNPRPREEGDRRLHCVLHRPKNFNPRPRKEGDLIQRTRKATVVDFNPRPRKEGDAVEKGIVTYDVNISIHALAKRATFVSKIC